MRSATQQMICAVAAVKAFIWEAIRLMTKVMTYALNSAMSFVEDKRPDLPPLFSGSVICLVKYSYMGS